MYPEKLENITTSEAEDITAFLKNMFDEPVKGFLIYQDSNYPSYFLNLINNNLKDCLFVVKKNLRIAGFAHFKIMPDVIFLNNIVIHSSLRGMGAGKSLLMFALNSLKQKTSSKFFNLDVFEKNINALNWYKKIGMKEIGKKYWYHVSPNLFANKYATNGDFPVKKDQQGFTGIYNETQKIATVINRSLLFRDIESINLFPANQTLRYMNACLITEEKLPCQVIDISLRLTVEMEKMKL